MTVTESTRGVLSVSNDSRLTRTRRTFCVDMIVYDPPVPA